MTALLNGWNGSHDLKSIAATVYTRWYFRFILSLFHNYSDDVDDRLSFVGNYHFTDAYQNILKSIDEEGSKSRFQTICRGAYDVSHLDLGGNVCAYNLARSLLEARQFLKEKMASDPQKWLWRDAHSNKYENMPWSRTPLRFLFERHTPCGGSPNTPNVSKWNIRKDKDDVVTKGYSSGNYKMLI